MKRILFMILTLGLTVAINAQKTDSARFYYVLQNPKFYGIDKAHSWFEIHGLKDKKAEAKINASLRKAYFERTELDTSDQGATMRTDDKTPKGFTDYSFYNGQTYGYGWIRFKDSDSLLYLNDADGYYGSGTNLGGFWAVVAEGKLAWIQITPSSYNDHLSRNNSITLAFHLGNGEQIKDTYTLHVDPLKRDSLMHVLDQKAIAVANSGIYHDSKILKRDPLSDTVQISLSQYIQWLNGKPNPYANAICRSFEVSSVMQDGRIVKWNPNGCLTFTEAIPFVKQDEWHALKEIYK